MKKIYKSFKKEFDFRKLDEDCEPLFVCTGGAEEQSHRVPQHERAQQPLPHHPHCSHPQRGEGIQRGQQGTHAQYS